MAAEIDIALIRSELTKVEQKLLETINDADESEIKKGKKFKNVSCEEYLAVHGREVAEDYRRPKREMPDDYKPRSRWYYIFTRRHYFFILPFLLLGFAALTVYFFFEQNPLMFIISLVLCFYSPYVNQHLPSEFEVKENRRFTKEYLKRCRKARMDQ